MTPKQKVLNHLAPQRDMTNTECICGHGIQCHIKAHAISRQDYEKGKVDRTCLHCMCRNYHAVTPHPPNYHRPFKGVGRSNN